APAHGQMWIAGEYREPLARAGLDSFEAVMSSDQGELLRTMPDRENWRLELAEGDARRAMYLKRHRQRSLAHWLRARLRIGPGATAGRTEAENAVHLQQSGIDAMRLVAYGERLRRDGLAESFVLTEELAGFTQLDYFLRQRFPPAAEQSHRDRQLERLSRNVADMAARFHRAGFNHRDFYCCHFFIRERRLGEFEVRLIDLQRVERRRRLRRRWIVKDLAQLAYSAPSERITCTRRMAFFKRYLGVRRLLPGDKRLIRQVLAKQRSLVRRHGAHP
ncbi:MAG: lipopolysaccharide kinase InaA family protein, partial [Candidatus Saccharimonadales bacterium]